MEGHRITPILNRGVPPKLLNNSIQWQRQVIAYGTLGALIACACDDWCSHDFVLYHPHACGIHVHLMNTSAPPFSASGVPPPPPTPFPPLNTPSTPTPRLQWVLDDEEHLLLPKDRLVQTLLCKLRVEDATKTIQICLTPAGTAVLGTLVAGLLVALLVALVLLGRRGGGMPMSGEVAAFRLEMSTAAGALVAMEARVTDLQTRHQQQTDRLSFVLLILIREVHLGETNMRFLGHPGPGLPAQ